MLLVVIEDGQHNEADGQQNKEDDIAGNGEKATAVGTTIVRIEMFETMTFAFVITVTIVAALVRARVGGQEGVDGHTLLIDTHRIGAAFSTIGHEAWIAFT